jgi:hypothetical protein
LVWNFTRTNIFQRIGRCLNFNLCCTDTGMTVAWTPYSDIKGMGWSSLLWDTMIFVGLLFAYYLSLLIIGIFGNGKKETLHMPRLYI